MKRALIAILAALAALMPATAFADVAPGPFDRGGMGPVVIVLIIAVIVIVAAVLFIVLKKRKK